MTSVISDQNAHRGGLNLRLIITRLVRSATSYVAIGVLIANLDAQISEPGVTAWVIVMATFGVVVGMLGGRAIDVLVASSAAAVISFAAFSMATESDPRMSDAIASGLLLGCIAGGLFRPWCRVSFGLLSVVRFIVRKTATLMRPDQGAMTVQSPAIPRKELRVEMNDRAHRKAS